MWDFMWDLMWDLMWYLTWDLVRCFGTGLHKRAHVNSHMTSHMRSHIRSHMRFFTRGPPGPVHNRTRSPRTELLECRRSSDEDRAFGTVPDNIGSARTPLYRGGCQVWLKYIYKHISGIPGCFWNRHYIQHPKQFFTKTKRVDAQVLKKRLLSLYFRILSQKTDI